jgi:hypothetical protein
MACGFMVFTSLLTVYDHVAPSVATRFLLFEN